MDGNSSKNTNNLSLAESIGKTQYNNYVGKEVFSTTFGLYQLQQAVSLINCLIPIFIKSNILLYVCWAKMLQFAIGY